MSLSRITGISFTFRLMVSGILTCLLYSTQIMAWQNVAYWPDYSAPVYYNAYSTPGYTSRYIYPAPPEKYSASPANQAGSEQATQKKQSKPETRQANVDISAKKQAFMQQLMPYIEKENTRLKRIRQQTRQLIQRLDNHRNISEKSKTWLKKLAKKYQINKDPLQDRQAQQELLNRVDIIPTSLTLAQAANESAWGKSRFASEANNLFGIWTYDESKGLLPQNRDTEKTHLVRKFNNYGESINYYMHLLNTHPAYKKLREIRQQMRKSGQTVEGHALANGLEKYSAKGEKYIDLIQILIRQNQWALHDSENHSV